MTAIVDLDVSEVAAGVTVLSSAEWTATPGTGFERATLLRIVGNLIVGNTAAGTAADAPALNVSLSKQGNGSAVVDMTDLTVLNSNDFLWMEAMYIGVSTIASAMAQARVPIDVTVKRKLDTDTNIQLAARITADAASPTGTLRGLLRFLVDRT